MKTFKDLPKTKTGLINLAKLTKAQKESYEQAIQDYLDVSTVFAGKKYLFQLTPSEREWAETDIFLDENGEFYSASSRQYYDGVRCNFSA